MRSRPNEIANPDSENRPLPSSLFDASIEQLACPATRDLFVIRDLPNGPPAIRNFIRRKLGVAHEVRIRGHLLKIEDPRETPSMIGTLIMRNLPVREIHRTK